VAHIEHATLSDHLSFDVATTDGQLGHCRPPHGLAVRPSLRDHLLCHVGEDQEGSVMGLAASATAAFEPSVDERLVGGAEDRREFARRRRQRSVPPARLRTPYFFIFAQVS
jgi:hypothetical protein